MANTQSDKTHTTNDAAAAANAAVDEASRIAAEASRRTAEQAQAAAQVSRAYLDQAADLGRVLYGRWSDGAEAWLQAALVTQDAALTAGFATYDAATRAERDLLTRWTDLGRQSQAAMIDAWRAGVRSTGQVFEDSAREAAR